MNNIKKLLRYDQGQLFWIQPRRGSRKGSPAGHLSKRGYIVVMVEGRSYLAHRLIWQMFHGPIPEGFQIDHIDRNKSNNRIENLRCVTPKENSWNRNPKGCYFNKKHGKWLASIMTEGRKNFLGLFEEEDQAVEAYHKAKNSLHKIHGETKHGYI